MTPNAPEAAGITLPAQPENAKPNNAQLVQVSKLFGSFAALRQVSLDLEPGRCYVLLGENGAGKSTLLRILAGLLRPSHGTVHVFGNPDPHQARARIGYMSHAPMLYDELTAQENLATSAASTQAARVSRPLKRCARSASTPLSIAPSANTRKACASAPRSRASCSPCPTSSPR